MSGDPAHAAIAGATALVESLLEHGCAGFVVSPGSRSTPLVLAIAASGAPAWIVLDERSAGFFALGRATATGTPVAIVTTSGTATANLLPAIVEASYRRVPVIAITADRPPELHGVGANQAIEQHGLYRAFVRAELDLDTATERGVDAWATAGVEAVRVAMRAPRGPVHVNAPFREPFTPRAPLPPSVPSWQVPAIAEAHATQGSDATSELTELLRGARRPVVYAGNLEVPGSNRVRAPRGLPVLTEAGANLASGLGTAALQVAAVREQLEPDLVVQLGRAPLTRAAQAFIASAASLVTVDPDGWINDPERRAAATLQASAEQISGSLAAASPEQGWFERWQRVADAVETAIASEDADLELWEGGVAREVARDGATVFAGNSMPIRDLDRYASRPIRGGVLANRGASGIDGLISTFAGITSVHGRAIALLGDLSTLHDASGLLWLAGEHPGTIVVLDNDGGGIFDLLASASLPEHERWFVTPHAGRLPRLLAASGVPVVEATTRDELRAAIAAATPRPPMRIVHVPIDRGRAQEVRAQIQVACERAAATALEE